VTALRKLSLSTCELSFPLSWSLEHNPFQLGHWTRQQEKVTRYHSRKVSGGSHSHSQSNTHGRDSRNCGPPGYSINICAQILPSSSCAETNLILLAQGVSCTVIGHPYLHVNKLYGVHLRMSSAQVSGPYRICTVRCQGPGTKGRDPVTVLPPFSVVLLSDIPLHGTGIVSCLSRHDDCARRGIQPQI
jgi:hypothetical protein